MNFVSDGSREKINRLTTKYRIDLESPSSVSREFNVGTILNCETSVRKCNQCTLI